MFYIKRAATRRNIHVKGIPSIDTKTGLVFRYTSHSSSRTMLALAHLLFDHVTGG